MINLKDYVADIQAIASKNDVPFDRAVNMFVLNLNVMKEQFKGASSAINFHTLGQQWSKMSSSERLKQKNAILKDTQRTTRRSNSDILK